jgi:hypothetical protein
MGQIIIDIPVEENLRFEVNSTKEYKELKKYLNSLCVKQNPSEDDEDAYDLKMALEAIERNNFITWEEAKARLNA